jgi:predicted glycosyl hydrolase (DUF1957 family)
VEPELDGVQPPFSTWGAKGYAEVLLEEPILREFEGRDNIFPEIDYRVYR